MTVKSGINLPTPQCGTLTKRVRVIASLVLSIVARTHGVTFYKRRDWMKWKVLRHDYQIVDSEIYHVIYLIRL
jgi:hypothetical protein